MHGYGFGFWPLAIAYLIMGIPIWRIVSKAGYSGAWSLIMFVPLVNLIMLWVFSFSKWPIER